MLRRCARNRPLPGARARSRGPLFVVALLLGALVTQAGRAQEAAPAASSGAAAPAASGGAAAPAASGGAAAPAASGGAAAPAASGGAAAPAASGGTSAPAASGGADAGPGPIDSSITVQSKRATKPPTDGARTMSTPSAPIPRQQPFPNPGDRTIPNAVGFPVARPGPPPAAHVPPPGSQPPTMSVRPKAPAGPTPGPPAGPGGASGGSGQQAPINRAGISGTGLTRPGIGPAMVQGSPKSLGTVSGTSLHPKR